MHPDVQSQLTALANDRLALLQTVPHAKSGLAWCRAHSDICDRVVRLIYDDTSKKHENAPPVAVIATGGYGRREMAPYSDIDVTVVPRDEASPDLDPFVRDLFQQLHAVFGTDFKLSVGYAYRLLS